tara:strand:+ start:544 stop:1068 length:525 start_codon:yes stop_codon:yes gene_type:complete
MASIFDTIKQQAGDRDLSLNWYKKKISDLSSRISASKLMRSGKLRQTPRFNRLHFFRYDPKTKAKLPYYDLFPLVMPIDTAKGGFLGINFHYLPIPARMKLLEALDKRNFTGDYSKLKNLRYIKPTIKHYLRSQFVSGFLDLEEDDYAPAIFMPVAQWKKASASQVHRDSRRRF